MTDVTYTIDPQGFVRGSRDGKSWPTGICLPHMEPGEISELELLDEVDIVFGPLSDGTARRRLVQNAEGR